MTVPPWHEEPISKTHDRASFDCGQADLNIFLTRYARQAHQSGSAKTYCAIESTDTRRILGFYTISPAQVALHHVPVSVRSTSGDHYALSGFRLGRLAVDLAFQGQGLGGELLVQAIRRCMHVSEEVGGTALLIDAKDEAAANWYRLFGAVALEDQPHSLVISYAVFMRAQERAGSLPLRFVLPSRSPC